MSSLLLKIVCLPLFHIIILKCLIKKTVFLVTGDQGHRGWVLRSLSICDSALMIFICHKCIAKGEQGGKDP